MTLPGKGATETICTTEGANAGQNVFDLGGSGLHTATKRRRSVNFHGTDSFIPGKSISYTGQRMKKKPLMVKLRPVHDSVVLQTCQPAKLAVYLARRTLQTIKIR